MSLPVLLPTLQLALLFLSPQKEREREREREGGRERGREGGRERGRGLIYVCNPGPE